MFELSESEWEAEFAFSWHSNNEMWRPKLEFEFFEKAKRERENLFESRSKEANLKATIGELKHRVLDCYRICRESLCSTNRGLVSY